MQRQLAPAYQIRNPPLFDWMYYVVQTGFSDGIVAHSLLRYVLIAAIGILHYAAFLQVGRARHLAAALSYSLIFFVWMASDFHYHFTHSLPLVAAGPATWICAFTYIERPRGLHLDGSDCLSGVGKVNLWTLYLPCLISSAALALVILHLGTRYFGLMAAFLGALAFILSPIGMKQIALARTDCSELEPPL